MCGYDFYRNNADKVLPLGVIQLSHRTKNMQHMSGGIDSKN